jgi:hypothetical protein
MTNALLPAAAALVCLCAAPALHAQVLTGSQVSTAVYCCSTPTEPDRQTNIVTAEVGGGVEVPFGALLGNVVPLNIDIGATTITLEYLTDSVAATGTFNGLVFRFQGAPAIEGVTVNGASTFTPVWVAHDANSVTINLAALNFTPSSQLVLDIALAVPEPATAAMLVAGLALLALRARRRPASGTKAAAR